jgi:hypothetical protein
MTARGSQVGGVESFVFQVRPVAVVDKTELPEPENPLEIELTKWSQTWEQLVGEMSKISRFPAFLVRDSESQRNALTLLTRDICRKASSPMESREYLRLSRRYDQTCEKVKGLEDENAALRAELIRVKADRECEIARIHERIETFELLVAEIQMNRELHDHVTAPPKVAETTSKRKVRRNRAPSVEIAEFDTSTSIHDDYLEKLIHRYHKSPTRSLMHPDDSLLGASLRGESVIAVETPNAKGRRLGQND